MADKLMMKQLDERLTAVEDREFPQQYLREVEVPKDLVRAIVIALTRTRSNGAWTAAEVLVEEYLPGEKVADFSEGVVTRDSLYSGGKDE